MPDVCGRRSSRACTTRISAWLTMLSRMIGGGAGACCACCCACSSSSSSSWGLPAAQKIMCPQTRSRAAGLWLAGNRRCGAPPVVCGGSKRPSASRWGRCSSEEVLGAFAPSTSGTQRPGRAEVSDRGFSGPSTHLLQSLTRARHSPPKLGSPLSASGRLPGAANRAGLRAWECACVYSCNHDTSVRKYHWSSTRSATTRDSPRQSRSLRQTTGLVYP
jgi:hypothetical protein